MQEADPKKLEPVPTRGRIHVVKAPVDYVYASSCISHHDLPIDPSYKFISAHQGHIIVQMHTDGKAVAEVIETPVLIFEEDGETALAKIHKEMLKAYDDLAEARTKLSEANGLLDETKKKLEDSEAARESAAALLNTRTETLNKAMRKIDDLQAELAELAAPVASRRFTL